ncbi:hypothetical protein SDC9_52609 [bioreactor metagenome]|uniref:Uncharacterized protein n=1 Tax=bioreactor metagenome TaxID=1076179 RepID=A0A644WR49_9ZZZZ
MPEFKIKGNLLYLKDIDLFLGGFCFESSSSQANIFTLDVFVQPLFIPCEYLFFTYGKRLPSSGRAGEKWWTYSEDTKDEVMSGVRSSIIDQGLHFLHDRLPIEKFLHTYGNDINHPDVNIAESVCYAYLLNNPKRESEAINHLNALLENVQNDIMTNSDLLWLNDVKKRVELIANYMKKNERIKAIDQLNEWKEYTLAQLKIDRQ